MAESVSLYSLSRTWAAVLFSLVLILQLAASSLFWRATLESNPFSPRARPGVLYPFFVGSGLFCGFLVFDEVLLIYRRFPNLEHSCFRWCSSICSVIARKRPSKQLLLHLGST